MKARLSLDQFADTSTMPEELQSKLLFKYGRNQAGKMVPIPYFPAGTEFTGDQAVMLCRTGQAAPADDECANALGYSAEKIAALQVDYKMNTLGINSKEDRELYRAGVILGYDKDLKAIPGPNWEAYQQALSEVTDEDED